MKKSNAATAVTSLPIHVFALIALAICFLTDPMTARAQSVVSPVPSVPGPPPGLRQTPTFENESVPLSEAVAGTMEESSPYKWGAVTFYPHAFYRFLYGDGIQAAIGQQETTAVHSLSPGILMDLGTHSMLDYTPTWTLYSNHLFADTLGQALNFATATSYEDWSLQFSQRYIYSDDTQVETGRQTTQQNSSTAFTATYHFNPHVLLDSILSQNLQFTKGLSDSRDWSVQERFHYEFSKRLDTFLAVGGGYAKQTASPDEVYVTPSLGVICRPTDKISAEVDAGYETRRFLSSSASNLRTPVFSASVGYQPISTTKLSLTASREVDASVFQHEVTKTTSLGADLNQRLLEHFYLDASFTHEEVSYVSTTAGHAAGRRDKFYSVNIKLSTTFLNRGTISIFFQNSHNSSTAAGFGFTSHQGGCEIGYRY